MGRVPTELGCVDPGCVAAPGCVVVVPGCDCVVEVPVCVPIPGLGVTEPVLCAVAKPAASTNTDDTNRILRIESCSLCTSVGWFFQLLGSFTLKRLCLIMGCFFRGGKMSRQSSRRRLFPPVARQDLAAFLAGRRRVGQMRCFASILPAVLKIKCEFLLCKLSRNVVFERDRYHSFSSGEKI